MVKALGDALIILLLLRLMSLVIRDKDNSFRRTLGKIVVSVILAVIIMIRSILC